MPSRRNLRNLQIISSICHTISFTLFSLTFSTKNQSYNIFEERLKKRTSLLTLCVINFIYVLIKLIFNIFSYHLSMLVELLYGGFVFIIIKGAQVLGLGYYFRAREFCILMNSLVKNPGRLLHRKAFRLGQIDTSITFWSCRSK